MTKPHIDEIQNDLQVIIDIANFTRVIDVETDAVQTEYEEVELEKNESCGGGMGMLMIILAVTRCEGILVKFFFFRFISEQIIRSSEQKIQ